MNSNRLIMSYGLNLLISFFVFVVISVVCPIRYESNDDIIMCMIANGSLGTPDNHLVFINAIYGWFFKILYTISPSIEWYTILFCVLHIISMSVIAYEINNKRIDNITKIVFLCAYLTIYLISILNFQFTIVAGFLSFAGCLLLLEENKNKKITGCFFVVVSSLIRFDACALVGLIFSPILFLRFLQNKKMILYYTIIIIMVYGLKFSNSLFYSHSPWSEYYEYNSLRGKLNDNPNAKVANFSRIDNCNVNVLDYKMLLNCYPDPDVLKSNDLSCVLKGVDSIKYEKDTFLNLYNLRVHWRIFPLILSFFILFLFLPRNIGKIMCGVSLLLYIGVLLYLALFFTLKNRVLLCATLPFVYSVFVYLYSAFKETKYRKMILCLMCLYCILNVNCFYCVRSQRIVKYKDYYEYQLPLVRDSQKKIIPLGLELECGNPFALNKVCKENNFSLIYAGWLTKFPYGAIQSHLDFCKQDVVVFSSVDAPPYDLAEAIMRNYKVSTNVRVLNRNSRYALYKIERKY